MTVIINGDTGITSPADSLSGNLNFTGTGNRITGDFSNATLTSRASFQTSTTNGITAVQAIPNGTATQTQFSLYTDPAITNGNYGDITLNNSEFRFRTNLLGTGTAVPMTFYTSGAERGRWNAGAPILCLSGGNTSATGTGIAFPATQSASSDANTLDDYEEGTFTPSVASADGTQPTVTYTTRSGIYVKVGQLVHFSLHIAVSTTSGGTGTLTFSGLPFTAANPVGNAGYQAVSVGYTASWTAAPYVPYNALIFQGTTNVRTYYTAVLGGNKVDSTVSQITNGLEIYLAGSYRCNA